MRKQVFNPYLPLYEYVPDGEPYVFQDKLYIFGSHDIAGGKQYCEGDYVSWSADVGNLGEWKYHGVAYRKESDPNNTDGKQIWAPDVAKGTDGRYYMYYCMAFDPHVEVCVADRPEGPYQFYGTVKYADDLHGGKVLEEAGPFDPAVLVDDDHRIYLYYGFGAEEQMHLPTKEELLMSGMKEGAELDAILASCGRIHFSPGAMCVELEPDMLTAKADPHMIVPDSIRGKGTSFEGHAFYEASSIRKIGNLYYFIYSSQLSHELCYAASKYPDRDFVYGGTLISNGDIGLSGNTIPRNTLGNNHGSIEKIGDDWYIFYHRQTHGTESSRQGCAEKLRIHQDGSIDQAEITSCGLNGGNLEGRGIYPAAICCNLMSKGTPQAINYTAMDTTDLAMILEEGDGPEETHIQFVGNINDGTILGYKYFEIHSLKEIQVRLRGNAAGRIEVGVDMEFQNIAGEARIDIHTSEWSNLCVNVKIPAGQNALFFRYQGEGRLDMKEFELVEGTAEGKEFYV